MQSARTVIHFALEDSLAPLKKKLTGRSLLVVIAIACFAIRLAFAYQRAQVPFQLDYEEGNILNAGERILHSQTPYPTPGSFPYVFNPYGPVGYVLAALGIKLFGLSLLGPRILVLIGGVCIALFIAALVARMGGEWQIGVLLGALWFCSPLVWIWVPLLRVDIWAVAFSLLGLYLFHTFPRLWPLAAIAFASAILTKHTALAAPLVCILELVREKKIKRAVVFASMIAAAVITPLLFVSGDPLFHLLRTHPDPYSSRRLANLYLEAVSRSLFQVITLAYAAVFGHLWNERTSVVCRYLILCTLTALTAGKLGSETNHFLEWTAALSILTGLALSNLIGARDSLGKPLIVATVALNIVLALFPQHQFSGTTDQAGCTNAYHYVLSLPSGSRVLSEDVTAVLVNGKSVTVSNPFVATQLGDSVKWSEGSLEELVDRRYFDLIILGGELENFEPSAGRWSPALMKKIGERYRPERRFQCLPSAAVAYVPNSDSE